MNVSRLLLRQWRKRPGRALATVASVAVAVAALVATWVAADASRAGYRRLAETVEGVPSIDISARGGGRFEATSLPRLADIAGVRAVVPLFFRPTLLRVGEKRVRELAVGVDVAALVDAGLLTLTAGRACEEADEIVLDSALAEGLEKQIDDEVIMFARRSIRRMTVVGIADSQSLKWFAEGGGVVVGIQPLEQMSNAFGLVDRVRVVVAPGGSRQAVLEAIAKRLPAALVAEVPAGRAGMAEDILHSANLGLDFVTGLTIAMAFFLVGNAMLMNVTERRRSFALLRVLGATGRQVQRFVTVEAAALGLVGIGGRSGARAGGGGADLGGHFAHLAGTGRGVHSAPARDPGGRRPGHARRHGRRLVAGSRGSAGRATRGARPRAAPSGGRVAPASLAGHRDVGRGSGGHDAGRLGAAAAPGGGAGRHPDDARLRGHHTFCAAQPLCRLRAADPGAVAD
jgi:ABC-type lipoprotein release transport system permease subunit